MLFADKWTHQCPAPEILPHGGHKHVDTVLECSEDLILDPEDLNSRSECVTLGKSLTLSKSPFSPPGNGVVILIVIPTNGIAVKLRERLYKKMLYQQDSVMQMCYHCVALKWTYSVGVFSIQRIYCCHFLRERSFHYFCMWPLLHSIIYGA